MDVEKVNKMVKVDLKESLKRILPEVFEDNKINFDKFKSLLGDELIEKEDDRFYFNWAGKRNIFKLIQTPAFGTLKPDKEKSVDFENTENIAIIGENLETLKLLLKPYFGKVKMIYIDPPYNTGKDFIYNDNFDVPLRDYLEKTGQIDSEGKKLTTNTEASGRYHSDWLNFIYPRLFLARNLLRDNGVIFVSIDEHEVHHLRMIMNEIFGEENFISEFITLQTSAINYGKIRILNEYLLCYAKNTDQIDEFEIILKERNTITSRITKVEHRKFSIKFPKGLKFEGKDGTFIGTIGGKSEPIRIVSDKMVFADGKLSEDVELEAQWSSPNIINELLNGREVEDKKGQKYIEIFFNKSGIPQYKKINTAQTMTNIIRDIGDAKNGTLEMRQIFGKDVFEHPKPVSLIKYLLNIVSQYDNIILDFFAGSGTTGQAVWDLNKEDGGNRKFILVQLDEPVDESTEIGRNALSLGLKTVADICIERLRRVSEKYKKEDNSLHFGFKVFRLDKSNFNLKDEFEIQEGEGVEELKQKYLDWLGVWIDQPLVNGWKNIDVVYEVMLKEGFNLNSRIQEIKIKNNNFYYVKDIEQELDFYISLDEKIDKETIEEIRTAKYRNKMFVFLDKALTDDDKINLTTFIRLKVI
ncbi:MAG: site-specific DNA-methyltransferase [Caldisericaceae bacterium]